jgi:hypothetical protein
MNGHPPLKPLHSDLTFSRAKLAIFERHTAEELRVSLQPGQEHCLKTRPDGTMLDGHHRVYVIRARGENVDSLPREVIPSYIP